MGPAAGGAVVRAPRVYITQRGRDGEDGEHNVKHRGVDPGQRREDLERELKAEEDAREDGSQGRRRGFFAHALERRVQVGRRRKEFPWRERSRQRCSGRSGGRAGGRANGPTDLRTVGQSVGRSVDRSVGRSVGWSFGLCLMAKVGVLGYFCTQTIEKTPYVHIHIYTYTYVSRWGWGAPTSKLQI